VSTIGGSGTSDIDEVKPCSINPKFRVDGPAATSRFAAPTRVQVVDGTLFVTDGMNGCIRTIKDGVVGSATPCCTADIATGPNGDGPQDLHVSDSHFYLLDSYNNQLKRASRPFGNTTGWTVLAGNGSRPHRGQSTDGPALQQALNEPHGLAVTSDGSGDVYLAETWSSCIKLLRGKTGELVTIAGKCGFGGHADDAAGGASARFQHPHTLALDPRDESSLYVGDSECWDDDPFPDDQVQATHSLARSLARSIARSLCHSSHGRLAPPPLLRSRAPRSTSRAPLQTAAFVSPGCGASPWTAPPALPRAS
jgi:hypothetical protein